MSWHSTNGLVSAWNCRRGGARSDKTAERGDRARHGVAGESPQGWLAAEREAWTGMASLGVAGMARKCSLRNGSARTLQARNGMNRFDKALADWRRRRGDGRWVRIGVPKLGKTWQARFRPSRRGWE